MRLFYYSIFLLLFLLFVFGCSSQQSDVIVAKYGKYNITLNDFEKAYARNAGGWENAAKDTITDYEDFLDLYLNFKMKLRDAVVRGYPEDEAMKNELAEYQKTVGVSYIIEKQINEPGIKQLYERRKEDLRVSHIMIRPDTSGDEAARKLAQSILDSIKNGSNYEEMAAKHSQDRFSAPNGGDIYYVTAGLLPYEFEDAMYATPVGGVYPEVVKTRFGYHIIKVVERIPRVPKVKASHILISYFNDANEMDSLQAELTADSVVAELKAGVPFEELVEKYSDDTGTKTKGGDLGFFERRMMVQPFDEAAFNMKVGEISNPVQTNFGYHIIKLTDKMEMPSFESERENLKNIFKKQRYDYEYTKLINSLKKKYNFTLNEGTVDYLVENSDSIRFGMVHPKLAEISDRILFTYADKAVTVGDFLEKAKENSTFTARPMYEKDLVIQTIDKVSENYLLEQEALNLDKTNPEFSSLMGDYRDGIFIFKLQEEEVWDKVKIDSADVYSYWEANKEKYTWPDRVSFREIFVIQDTTSKKIYQWLQEGADFDSLAARYSERDDKNAGKYPLHDVASSDMYQSANKLENPGDFSEPMKISNGYSIIQLTEKQPAGLKTFKEAKAEVSGEYQEVVSKKLESDYVLSLKKRYQPEEFYDELENAFKSTDSK